MKTLILRIGNPVFADDGVDIQTAQKLKEEKPEPEVIVAS